MVPYFIMVGIPAFLALVFKLKKYQSKKVYQLVIDAFFLIWLSLLFFRSETVGIDLPVYKLHFTQYPKLSWIEIFTYIFTGEVEAGYILLVKGLSYFTSNFRWVMIVCACIAVIPIWKLYRNEGAQGFLVIVLFLNIAPFPMYFSGLRQAMAMAFVVPCYRYCKEKQIFQYLLMILAACMFHRSALIMLFMYPVYHLRLKKQWHIFYLIPIIGVIYIFNVPIFRILALFMGGTYSEYLDSIQPTGAYAVTLLLFVILVYTYLIPDQTRLDEETVGLRNLLILCVIFQIFSGVHTIAMRMNYYYLLFVPILIPRIIMSGKKAYKQLIQLSIICMVVFFIGYYFYYAYTDEDILNVYPYSSFVEDIT